MTKERFKSISLRKKMIMSFCIPTVLLFLVNMMLYIGTAQMLSSLDKIYASNNSLNRLSDSLDKLQTATVGYLNTKTSDALEQYYIYEQEYSDLVMLLDDNKDENDSDSTLLSDIAHATGAGTTEEGDRGTGADDGREDQPDSRKDTDADLSVYAGEDTQIPQ